MNENKLFINNISSVSISNLLIAISSFFLLSILTKNFSTADCGIWIQIAVSTSLISTITTLGLPFSMVRFLSFEKNKDKIKSSFFSMFIIVIIFSVITCLILIVLAPIYIKLFNNRWDIFPIFILWSFIASLNTYLINFFRTFQKINIYSILLVLQTYIGLFIVVVLVLMNYNITMIILGLFSGYLIVFIIMLVLILNKIGIYLPKFEDIKNIKPILKMGIDMVPGNISSWIIDSSDKYIIGFLLGISYTTYYSTGYSLGNILMLFLTPFAAVLPTALTNFFEDKNFKKIKFFLKHSIKFYLIITIPAVVGVSLLSYEALALITTPTIAANGYIITPFVALGALFMGLYGIFNNILLLNKKTRVLRYLWTFTSFFNIFGSIIAVNLIGIIGAAIITSLSYLIVCIVTVYYSNNFFKIKFDYASILKSIFSSIIMGIIIILINPKGFNIIWAIGLSIISYLLIILLTRGLKKEEIKEIKNILKN